DSVPDAVRTAVSNNAGGRWNRCQFWKTMGPNGGGGPTGKLADAINAAFGDFEKCREALTPAGVGRFGWGWVWLVNEGGKLANTSTPNQDNPLMDGKAPP